MKAALVIILILIILLIISLCTTTYVLIYSRKRPVIHFKDTNWTAGQSGCNRSGLSVGSGSTIKPPLSLNLSKQNGPTSSSYNDPESPLLHKNNFEDSIKRRTTYIEVASCYSSSSSSCDEPGDAESTIEFQSGPRKLAQFSSPFDDDQDEADSNSELTELTEEPTIFGDMTMEVVEVKRVPPAVLVDKRNRVDRSKLNMIQSDHLIDKETFQGFVVSEIPESINSLLGDEHPITSTPQSSPTHRNGNHQNINQITAKKFF